MTEGERRILVLDDEPIVVERLTEALKREGLAVEGFTEGAAALRALRERPFHVVVTDLKMRPPTGMDLVQEVRRSFPETRLLVITGYADRETWESLRKAGVAEIVAKPFRLREVVERVKAL